MRSVSGFGLGVVVMLVVSVVVFVMSVCLVSCRRLVLVGGVSISVGCVRLVVLVVIGMLLVMSAVRLLV